MKYDPEYNSYKFSSEELIHIVDGLNFYKLYSPLEDKFSKSVEILIDNLIKSTKMSINQ
jgi:hypothetical protein